MSPTCSSLASASTSSFPHGFRTPATAKPLSLGLLSSPIPHPNPRSSRLALALPRRLFLPSASAIWDALTGGNRTRDASLAVRRGMLLFRQVGQDPRPIMRQAYNLFKDGGDPKKLVTAFSDGQENEYFYASLYAGLFYESQNDMDAAKLNILASCRSPYGSRSDDYMASLAKVHCLCRNWSFS